MSNDFNSLAADLTKAADASRAIARSAVEKTAADISADAKVFAPVATGNLRNSIGYDIMSDATGTSAEIGPTASYAPFVEYPTSHTEAQPFLGPAFERRMPGFEAALKRIGGDIL